MYHTLFSVAGVAMVGWLLLIFLPGWWITRKVAQTAVFPLFLSLLYLVGIVAVLRETGPGIMGDFGSAEGVLDLLSSGPVALVAWIHILAFDHLVGVLIYRDNMKHRFVALPVQSVLLLATLMFGPVGFLGYWLLRSAKRRGVDVAWGDPDPAPERGSTTASTTSEGSPAAPTFRSVVQGDSIVEKLFGLWRREWIVAGVGLLGFAFAGVTAVIAAVNGSWLMEPEGRLMEAIRFDVAVGIYMLTLALVLPLAPLSERGRRRWIRWTVGLTVFSYGVESIQAWRGLDPRFSQVAGPLDQMLGGVFFLAALGIMVLFFALLFPFFRARALPDHPPLRLSFRYAVAASLLAFGVGILISFTNSRMIGEGDLMLIHAGGFHALQAVPLVALLMGAGGPGAVQSIRWTHIAGVGWLVFCIGLAAQAILGNALGAPSVALLSIVVGAGAWLVSLGYAVRWWMKRKGGPAIRESAGPAPLTESPDQLAPSATSARIR